MLIIGCHLHTRTEQIAMLDTETVELVEKCLGLENREAKRFYAGLTRISHRGSGRAGLQPRPSGSPRRGSKRGEKSGLKEPALVGIESKWYALWFAELLAELGQELVVGDAAKIRGMEVREQKHDRRDAELASAAVGQS